MNEKGMNKERSQEGSASMPGMIPAAGDDANFIADNYTVKYFRGDLDEPGDLLELQRIETVGLKGDEIVLCDRQTYSFEGRFFVVLRYFSKRI